MSIVAISQTLGSLGEEIARELAQTLACEFADREIILRAAERFGEGVGELQHVTEEKPTLWERFTETRERYLTYVEAIIWELAARDNVVLVGRGASFLLAAVPRALRVRITAPERLRAKRVAARLAIDPDAAGDLVRDSDRERAARVRFLYHVDWDDPRLYDVVLNTERMTVSEGTRIIQHALQSERLRATSDSQREIKDLSVAAAAKAALRADPRTRQLWLAPPVCRNGRLSIGGMVAREQERRVAEEIVSRIPGVTAVLNEIVVATTGALGDSVR